MNDRHSCDRTPPPDLVTQRWRSIIKNSLFSFQISWMEVLVQVRKQRFSGNELQTTSCFGCPFFSTPKVTRLHWQNQTFYLTDNRKLSNFIALSKPPDSIHKSTRLTSSTTTLSGLTLKKTPESYNNTSTITDGGIWTFPFIFNQMLLVSWRKVQLSSGDNNVRMLGSLSLEIYHVWIVWGGHFETWKTFLTVLLHSFFHKTNKWLQINTNI